MTDNIKKRFRHSILNKILVPVITILAGAVGTSTYLAFVQETKILGQNMTHRGVQIAETVSTSTINSFVSLNWIYTENLLKQSIKNHQDLIFIKVANPLNEVYLASHERFYGEAVLPSHATRSLKVIEQYAFNNEAEKGLHISYPFKVGTDTWHVLVGISDKTITELKRSVLIRSAANGMLIIFVGIILSIIISSSLSRPLIQLSHAVNRVSNGEFAQLEIHSEDEIGLLGRNFNNMSIRLQATMKSLEDHQQNLELMVKERTQKLEQIQAKLVNQAVEAGRAQLSAMVLHNIGNAITPVVVTVENLGDKNYNQILNYLVNCYDSLAANKEELTAYVTNDSRGKEIFHYMGDLIQTLEKGRFTQEDEIRSIKTGLNYVADILTLQQSYSSNRPEPKQRTDLSSLVRDAVIMQKRSFDRHGIAIGVDLLKAPPALVLEKNKLMQVVINLLKNSHEAVKAHVRINENADKWIKLRVESDSKNIYLAISDSGIGVKKNRQKAVFEFGVSSKGSSGFGLYYCNSFMQSNQGCLMLESEGHLKGACVTLRFLLS